MKLILLKNGVQTEIKEITSISKDSNMLFFFLNSRLRSSDIERIENELSRKTGVKCIVLDALFLTEIKGC